MLRTVTWQRDEAVPAYVELLYDAAAWDRIAADYQKRERLLLNPLLALMAYRLVAAAKENRRLASTIVGDQRLAYDNVNVGFTVQTDSALYLTVVEKADQLTCREFVIRLTELQRSAMAHRLRANETSGATVGFTSMARWNATRHIPVLPSYTSLIVAHAAPLPDGRGVLGATYRSSGADGPRGACGNCGREPAGGSVVTRSFDLSDARRTIRDKVIELAGRRGVDASNLQDTELIPESGALDSVGILELITWFEMTFDITIAQTDLTVENFGTIEAMASYLQRR